MPTVILFALGIAGFITLFLITHTYPLFTVSLLIINLLIAVLLGNYFPNYFGQHVFVLMLALCFIVTVVATCIGRALHLERLFSEELEEQEEFKRQAEAKEAELASQREWQEKVDVYIESEMLKGASRTEATKTAHELAGPSPAERKARIAAKRKERLEREAAERARKEEKERLRREAKARTQAERKKIQHDLEVLEKRAQLDRERQLEEAERAEREARRKARKQMNTPTKRILQKYATDSDSAGWKAAPAAAGQTNSSQEPASNFPVAEYAWLDAFLQGERDVQCDALPGNEWWRYSVGGEVFAVLHIPASSHAVSGDEDFVDEAHPLLTVRCKPDLGEYLQSEYTGILPAEYAEGNTWVVINLDGSVTKDLIRVLSAASYGMALG